MKLSLSDFEHARAFAPRSIADVVTLNAHVSAATLEQIDRIRKSGALAPSSSLLVLGPAGTGKTHLFERMRRRVGPQATFVHVRPEIGVESTLSHVLLTVLDALKQPVADRDYTQLDLVVGSALAVADGDNPKFPSAFIDKARGLSETELSALIERAVDRFEREDARLDASWLELLLGVPFKTSALRRAALTWLSGREPSELELGRLGRTEPLRESAVKGALRALATVAAQAAPLVIVFDQLENLVETDGRTDRIHAHARVFAELFDEVARLVLVQMALDGEWLARVGPALGASERSRLEANVLHVTLPNVVEREELLRGWLEQLPQESRPGAFPAPFHTDEWARIAETPGLTPRMLFVAARKALEGERPFADAGASVPDTVDVDDMLARHWEDALREAHTELDRASVERRGIDESRLAAAMRVLLLRVPGTAVTFGNGRGDKASLRVARSGEESLVFIVQGTNGRSVASTLGHALKAADTRAVVVVREQSLMLPPTWKLASEHMDALRRVQRARVLELGRAELARSLALHDFVADARSQDLAGPDGKPIDEETVLDWVARIHPVETCLLALVGKPEVPSQDELPAAAPEQEAAPTTHATSTTSAVLASFRLASVERIVAEVRKRDPRLARARVLAELRAHEGVRWFGRTIVHLPSEEP